MKAKSGHTGKIFLILIFAVFNLPLFAQEKKMKYNKLTKEEERVIIYKGT